MQSTLVRLLVVILSGVSLTAFYVVLNSFFPKALAKTQRMAHEYPKRTFLIGLVNFLFFSAITMGFFLLGQRTSGLFVIPGLFFAVPLAIGITFGIGGLIGLVGERLFADYPPGRRIAFGTLILYAACLTPVVGWFGLTVFLAVYGLGAFLLSFIQRSPGNQGDIVSPQSEEEEEENDI